MAYAIAADLITRFGEAEIIQLTDRTNLGVVDVAVLTKAIFDASSVIDGYLRNAYSLPLASTPAELNRACADIARYFLYEDRVTEQVKMRRDDSISWLKDLSIGKANLAITAVDGTETEPPSLGYRMFYSAAPRIFNTGNAFQ